MLLALRAHPDRRLDPPDLPPPFAFYAHGIEVPAGGRPILTLGRISLAADGTVPEGVMTQARFRFAHRAAILREGGMGAGDVVRTNAFVTDRTHMAGYMAARDADFAGLACLSASTPVILSGVTRPDFVVEAEPTAAA